MKEHTEKKKAVKYIKGYDRWNLPEYGNKMVPADYVQSYKGFIWHVYKLSLTARNVLDYLINYELDDNNIVTTDSHMRKRLNKGLVESGLKPYAVSSISFAIKELVEKEFLFKIQRGRYVVNPIYWNKGKLMHRPNKIRVIIEFQNGIRTSVDTRFITESLKTIDELKEDKKVEVEKEIEKKKEELFTEDEVLDFTGIKDAPSIKPHKPYKEGGIVPQTVDEPHTEWSIDFDI